LRRSHFNRSLRDTIPPAGGFHISSVPAAVIAQRRRFDVIMAWAIDRLGRSAIDLLGTIQTLEACGVDLYLDQQSIDTATPAGRLMFQVSGAFAEFERSTIRQRVHGGLARAVEKGQRLGRPKIDVATNREPRRVCGLASLSRITRTQPHSRNQRLFATKSVTS
jgi:DNA invertase Pin-like site-specific DNA recombinase